MAQKKEIILLRRTLASIGFGLLFVFLIGNILFSQRIPELYFQIVNGDSTAYVEFLKQGREANFFQLLSPEIRNIFASHEKEIYADERQRRALIQKLKILQKQNPKSRDILYSLYLLYDKSGDENLAQQYLQQAKEIDPAVSNH